MAIHPPPCHAQTGGPVATPLHVYTRMLGPEQAQASRLTATPLTPHAASIGEVLGRHLGDGCSIGFVLHAVHAVVAAEGLMFPSTSQWPPGPGIRSFAAV